MRYSILILCACANAIRLKDDDDYDFYKDSSTNLEASLTSDPEPAKEAPKATAAVA